jgi:hypothetical protein
MKKRWKKKNTVRGKERTRVLFGGKFLPLGKPKKLDSKLSKGSFLGKRALSCHISRENKLNLPYLDRRFLYVASI